MPPFGHYEDIAPLNQPGLRTHFGRLKRFDPRSMDYQIRRSRLTLWRSLTAAMRRSVRHRPWWQGDQKSTSQCVAFSTLHAWEAGKAHARGRGRPLQGISRPPITPQRVYSRAQELDPWPGSENVPPQYEGSSCTAGAKAAQEFGLITGYDWEFTDIEVCERAIFTAPLVFGIDWKTGMMLDGPPRTRWEDAVIKPTGSLMGGHAIAAVGYDKRRKGAEFTLLNSWGPAWGLGGRCYISKDDLGALLLAEGECVMLRDEEDDKVLEALRKIA
jgi:hypothetical protein